MCVSNLFGVHDPGALGSDADFLGIDDLDLGFHEHPGNDGLEDITSARCVSPDLRVPMHRLVEPLDDDVPRRLGHTHNLARSQAKEKSAPRVRARELRCQPAPARRKETRCAGRKSPDRGLGLVDTVIDALGGDGRLTGLRDGGRSEEISTPER
jgi:hypothetical protein